MALDHIRLYLLRLRIRLRPSPQHRLARLLPLRLTIFLAAIEGASQLGHHSLNVYIRIAHLTKRSFHHGPARNLQQLLSKPP
jgi:hypothetical protein